MTRKTANIASAPAAPWRRRWSAHRRRDIRVQPELVEKIDAWRARQRVPPSRAAAIAYMLEDFLERDLFRDLFNDTSLAIQDLRQWPD